MNILQSDQGGDEGAGTELYVTIDADFFLNFWIPLRVTWDDLYTPDIACIFDKGPPIWDQIEVTYEDVDSVALSAMVSGF